MTSSIPATSATPILRDPTQWAGFGEFTVTIASDPDQRSLVAAWLDAEHFLGSVQPVGHSLIHLICEDGVPVAVVQWGACAFRLKDREEWIGWGALTCAKRRNLVVNNVRFLVREAARRPNLASKALAHSLKVLAAHWQERFGYEPLLAETFTDIELHAGTCYKASGWIQLGLTDGNSRQRSEFYVPNDRPKKLWIKPLRPDARDRLCAKTLAPEHAAGETSGKGAPLPVKASALQSLLQALRSVPDPRAKNSTHSLQCLLTLIAFGILCGCDNLNAMVRQMQRLTQAQRRLLEVRGKAAWKGSRLFKYAIPDYETFRGVLCSIDLDAFARVLSDWLSAHRGALPADLSLDGKVIRGQLGTIVTLCDIASKKPVALAATTAEGGEQACARALIDRPETTLLNTTVSLDALYTNATNAQQLVQEKGADYLLSIKGNQPTLEATLEKEFAGIPFFPIP